MPVTNVTSAWVSGNLVFYDKDGNIIVTYDGTNRKLTLPSGSTFESLGTNTIADASLAAADIALTTGSLFIGASNKAAALDAKGDGKILIGNGTTAAMQSLGTDVTMTNTGAVTIANNAITAAKINADAVTTAKILDGSVTSAKLANGAGVAALLAAGLGGSHVVLKTETETHTIVAADATKDRAVIGVVVVDEAFATGDTSATVITIGEADTPNKGMANTVLVNGVAAGAVFTFAFTNTATKAITVTSTAAAGTGTGGCSVAILAIPTT